MPRNKKKPRPALSKIKSPQALARLFKKNGKKSCPVVFTNGCFDLLHKGHVAYLHQARNLGSTLVVALNDDASVQSIKGPKRPINPLAERMFVMAALECVDFVTWFEEDTPLNIIQVIQPDVLVKGGDWKAKDIIGSEVVLARGGKVRSLPYLKGHSTTSIINKMG